MLKEFLTNIGVIKESHVSPKNLLVNSYIYGFDDNRGVISKGNLLVGADLVKLNSEIEVEKEPQDEVK